MTNLEINTQLFDDLGLHQRIQAIMVIQLQLNIATEKRLDRANEVQGDDLNGAFVALYVVEDAINKVMQSLIDSTVEKFGDEK